MIHLIQRSVVIARCIVMINFLTDAIKYTNVGDYHSICQKNVKKARWGVDWNNHAEFQALFLSSVILTRGSGSIDAISYLPFLSSTKSSNDAV